MDKKQLQHRTTWFFRFIYYRLLIFLVKHCFLGEARYGREYVIYGKGRVIVNDAFVEELYRRYRIRNKARPDIDEYAGLSTFEFKSPTI